ncbi:MAG: stage II sporulation protein P [Syntrophothermus sp.]
MKRFTLMAIIALAGLSVWLQPAATFAAKAPAKKAPVKTPARQPVEKFVDHSVESGYYTIIDQDGRVISMIASKVSVGDYLITEDNHGYTIVRVVGKIGYARFDRVVNLEENASAALRAALSQSGPEGLWDRLLAAFRFGRQARGIGPVGIYNTHSDESYVPTSGTASKDWGDIYQAAAILEKRLKEKGLRVIRSRANHNPHDDAAYVRSRRTVTELLKSRPVALIDVHRDGIPNANYYRKRVSGKEIAQVRLVVGKENANRAVNFEFAKFLKAKADKIHPGLIKEIFWAVGDYNQDVGPRTILFEFGTHLNSLKAAQDGAQFMADVVAAAVTSASGPSGTTRAVRTREAKTGVKSQSGTGARSALWVLGAVIAGGLLFVVLNTDSWEGFKRRLRHFGGKELSGFMGAAGSKKARSEKGRTQEGKKLDAGGGVEIIEHHDDRDRG